MGATRRPRRFANSIAAIIVLLSAASPARAAGPDDAPHIRPLLTGVDSFVAEGIARSETIRSLVDRIGQSDLIVYIRAVPFRSPLTTGHLLFVSATQDRRYVMIEIACGESWRTQLATLGHELRHAVEVAEAPSIRSERALAAHYTREGMIVGADTQHESFETAAAVDAGRQVARELLGGSHASVALLTANAR